jgi:hypothetical protein
MEGKQPSIDNEGESPYGDKPDDEHMYTTMDNEGESPYGDKPVGEHMYATTNADEMI